MSKQISAILIAILINLQAYCQTSSNFSLFKAIEIAKSNSIDYQIALNKLKSSSWNYENFKSVFLPKLNLTGTLPDYYRSINSITQPDGSILFIGQNIATSSSYLNLNQNISLTGGNISVGSSLSRIDNFGNYRYTSYTSVPLTINYVQNNLFYNEFKWKKKIEPLRLQEAQREYLESMENISYSTVSQYFDYLIACKQLDLDKQNYANIDTLLKITKSRFEIGTAQLNDTLQAKISLLNARGAMANSLLVKENSRRSFHRYLNIDVNTAMDLNIPDSTYFFNIDPELALAKAKSARKYVIEFRRRKLEAEQAVAKTHSETGPILTIRANIGLTQTGASITNAYQNLLRNQAVTLGFDIPLIDWGVNKSNRKRAQANLELENNLIAQDDLTNEQEIYTQTMKWEMQKLRLETSREAERLALQRYNISKQKYSLGSMSFTDFNNAQLEKDRTTFDYLENLRGYWLLYYSIRKLTLFDFQNGRNIVFEAVAFH